MRKKATPPPSAEIRRPITIRRDAMISVMRSLTAHEGWGILRSRWLSQRIQILEDGKAKPSNEAWARLAGFDEAIMEAEKWANLETKEDTHNKQARDLEAQIKEQES